MYKVYYYPGSLDAPTHGGPYCFTPFRDGAETVIEKTDNPYGADLLFAGQFHDTEKWKLNPNRFAYFKDSEDRHVFDLDGDRWPVIPEWLRGSLLSGMNGKPIHKEWRFMARPGSSQSLVRIATKEPPGFVPPKNKTLWFRGQPDSGGLRKRLASIVEAMDVESDIQFNNFWGAGVPEDSSVKIEYEKRMRESAFVLSPGGEGWGATLRMYEACYYGCVPIIISDCLIAWEDYTDTSFMVRISPDLPDDKIADAIKAVYDEPDDAIEDRCRMASMYFDHVVRRYFRNPTEFFLAWLEKKGTKN